MKRHFLLWLCLLMSCVCMAQQPEGEDLSALFDTDMGELYQQRLDALGRENIQLKTQLEQAQASQLTTYRELGKANEDLTGIVSFFRSLIKIETGQAVTNNLVLEYSATLQRYFSGIDTLLRVFPHAQSLYKEGKLAVSTPALHPDLLGAYTTEVLIPPALPPRPAFSATNKQKLVDDWNNYTAQVVGRCGCPNTEYKRYNSALAAKKEKAKADFLKNNKRAMTPAELMDVEIELAQKCAFLIEKKYCAK